MKRNAAKIEKELLLSLELINLILNAIAFGRVVYISGVNAWKF